MGDASGFSGVDEQDLAAIGGGYVDVLEDCIARLLMDISQSKPPDGPKSGDPFPNSGNYEGADFTPPLCPR